MSDFTPTPEVVEAVAKAIEVACDGPWDRWEDVPPSVQGHYRHQADAAIAAFVEAEGLTRRAGWTDKRVRVTEWTIERPLEEA